MDRITVSNSIAEKIKRFPQKVYLCDESGHSHHIVERAESPDEVSNDQILTNEEIVKTLQIVLAEEISRRSARVQKS